VLGGLDYAEPADVYSFAICLWELVTGRLPYEGQEQVTTAVAVLKEGARPPLPPALGRGLPEGFIHLMTQCWDQVPARRPAFDRIVAALRDL